MVEEIITALSRVRWFFVIARNSSFTYKGQAIDVKQVGRELGVRYVLQGSVRKAGTRVRITGQLIDTLSGTHLWADRFDGSLEDVFDLQDTVASSVAGVIEPALRAAETARSAGRPTNDLTAYDLYLRAYALVWSSARQSPQALRLMEQAIERDPHYGPALAWAAYCCYRLLIDDRSEHRGADALKGADFARRALLPRLDALCVVVSSLPDRSGFLGQKDISVRAKRRDTECFVGERDPGTGGGSLPCLVHHVLRFRRRVVTAVPGDRCQETLHHAPVRQRCGGAGLR